MHFAGLDWASQEHVVCIIDERGSVLERFAAAHDQAGLDALCERLLRYDDLSISIERPSGLVVDTLLEAGLRVVAVHPNVVKAARSRYRTAGKSDAADAYVLADLLRTDGHRFAPLVPHSEEIKSLRLLVRLRKDLVHNRVGLANQLRALLHEVFPGAAGLFSDVDSAIALTFLRTFPSEAAGTKLTEKRLARFLTEQGYSGRRSAAELLARLRTAPRGIVSEDLCEASAAGVMSLVTVLEPIVAQISALTAKIDRRLDELPDAKIICSVPGSGRVTAAAIVAKLGSDRHRFKTPEQLAALAGVTPVTHSSGKHHAVRFRWACDHELREAFTCLADNSRKRSAWAASMYRRARDRGCDHPHAIRILARAWTRVIWRCWQDGVPYDPTKHGEAAKLLAA
ncbi:MAG TPA: IS110 family transposase [Candidatus Limnocylindria bacterium]|jgi:transposase|nr:IS110 family transposase [Candidatus Limnocylindria bacterium]